MNPFQNEESLERTDVQSALSAWRTVIKLASKVAWYIQEQQPYLRQLQIMLGVVEQSKMYKSPSSTRVQRQNQNQMAKGIASVRDLVRLAKEQTSSNEVSTRFIRAYFELILAIIEKCTEVEHLSQTSNKYWQITRRFVEGQLQINESNGDEHLTQQLVRDFTRRLDRQLNRGGRDEQKKQSSFQKIIAVVNRRFTTLNCLDVEYNSYKSQYFQSRSQQDELFKDYTQRNQATTKTYLAFFKQFKKYQKRRSRKQETTVNTARIQSVPTPPPQSNTIHTTTARSNNRNAITSHSRQKVYNQTSKWQHSLNRFNKTITQEQELEQLMQQQMQSVQRIQDWKNKTNYHLNKVDLGMQKGSQLPGYLFNHCIGEPTRAHKSGLPKSTTLTSNSKTFFTPMKTQHLVPTRTLHNSPTPSKGIRLVEIHTKNNQNVPKSCIIGDSLSTFSPPNSGKVKGERTNRIHKYNYRRIDKKIGSTISSNYLSVLNTAMAEQPLGINPEL